MFSVQEQERIFAVGDSGLGAVPFIPAKGFTSNMVLPGRLSPQPNPGSVPDGIELEECLFWTDSLISHQNSLANVFGLLLSAHFGSVSCHFDATRRLCLFSTTLRTQEKKNLLKDQNVYRPQHFQA